MFSSKFSIIRYFMDEVCIFISLSFLSCFCCLEAVDLDYMFDSSDFQFVQWN